MRRLLYLLGINLFLVALLGVIAPYFLTKENLVVIFDNMALEAIALSGYTLLLIAGHFDLSVDGIVAITGVVAGLLMVHGIFWVLAVIIALVLSVLIGTINGVVVVRMGISGLIATMASWFICIGLSLGLTKALAPYGFPEAFQWIGQSRVLGFRSVVIVAVLVAVVLSIILHRTPFGAHVYASGDNRQSCEMRGINTTKIGISLYILVGVLSGIIGLIVAARLNAASPMAVDGMALRVIAAIVIGGGSLSGGKGTIIGGLLGLSIMHILSNAIIQLGISPYYQKAVLGGILLTAVLAETPQFTLRRKQNVA